MTYKEFLDKIITNYEKENANAEIISIGTLGGSDKDCEFIIHLDNEKEIKI